MEELMGTPTAPRVLPDLLWQEKLSGINREVHYTSRSPPKQDLNNLEITGLWIYTDNVLTWLPGRV